MSRIDEALKRAAGVYPGRTAGRAAESTLKLADEVPLDQYLAEAPAPESVKARPTTIDEPAIARPRVSAFAERPLVKVTIPPDAKLVIGPEVDAASVEQYRRLAAMLHEAQVEKGLKTVMVTSAGPGDGKTLTVVNLGLTLSESYGRRVLLVDDNHDAADSLRELLELWGHQIAVAYGGAEALALAPSFRPDLVLCDLAMPGMDGPTVCERLHQNPALAGVRWIAVTGYHSSPIRERATAAGFSGFLLKPIDPAELLRQLAA